MPPSDDLVARLRKAPRGVFTDSNGEPFYPDQVCHQAADCIEALTARVQEIARYSTLDEELVNADTRAALAEARVRKLEDDVLKEKARADRLAAALGDIADRYLGDCPAAQDELAHARSHISDLRHMAHNAFASDGGEDNG